VSSGLPAALLKHGMDVNKPFKCGLKSDSCTQLTRLARKETQDINDMFYLLASNGANLNAKATMMMNVDVLNTGEIKTQEREVTPLHVAAYFNESEFYSRLIALGADETITDNQGNTPEQYANQFFRLKKSSRQQKEIYQQDVRERQAAERQSRDAVFGKALALGLGAAAISSVDVDSDIKAEVFSAFAEDVVTDSNGKNLNAINNRARSELQQQQQAFAKEVAAQIEKNTTVVAEVDGQQEKRVDCVYEYLKATQRVKSSGFKAECIEAHEDMKFCANKKRRMYHDEANRLLVEANLSQCQLDYLTPPTVPNKIRTKGGGSYEV
jgi:hypothetical protein